MLISLLLVLASAQAEPPAATPVTVKSRWFEAADLSVSYELVVPLGVAYYKTQIEWRFSDGTSSKNPKNWIGFL